MERPRILWPRRAYIVSAFLVTLVVGALWVATDRATMKTHLALAERNRALQVELARNAMEEGFIRLVQENAILASYSFPEYEHGLRDASSMNALLESELSSYTESLAYAYFEVPVIPTFIKARPGAQSAVDALKDSSATVWEGFAPGDGPIILPGSSYGTDPYFMLMFPVFVDGSMRGILGTAVSLAPAIDKYLRPLASGKGRRSFVMFGAGRILWSSDSLNPTLFELEENSLLTMRSFKLANAELSVIADDFRSSLVSDLYHIETPRLLVFISGMLIFSASMFAANRIYLERRSRLALADEERRLSERIARREQELNESELRYKKLFDGANDAILVIEDSGIISACNDRAVSLLARPADDIVGRSPAELSPARQSDGTASLEKQWLILGKTLEGQAAMFEWEHLRGDGSIVELEVSLSFLIIGQKQVYLAFLRDITERNRSRALLRDALEDRELLLRELHHRVKNNFQFIESLIELQKDGEPDVVKLALSKIQSRTSALAAAYLITAERPDTLKVDIREYINVLSSQALEGAGGGRHLDIDIDCEALPLSLDVAVSLGLLYREILTNAMVHGYPDAPLGRVEVRFRQQDNNALLSVRDYGRGYAAGTADSLGLTITRALVRQLNGTLDIQPGLPGTLVEALFPLS